MNIGISAYNVDAHDLVDLAVAADDILEGLADAAERFGVRAAPVS